MFYTGRARGEKRRIGLAKPSNGISWSRESLIIEGTQPWDNQVVCDPTVELLPGQHPGVWFGGGDVPSPDQGSHGQIGVGILK